MAYSSWRGASPVGYGIGAGLTQGLAQGAQNFIGAYQKQNQLASEIAHQKAEEEYRKNALAQQKELADKAEKAKAEQARITELGKYVREGKTPPPELTPVSSEEQAARQEYESTLGNRNVAAQERAGELTGTRFEPITGAAPKPMPGLQADELHEYNARRAIEPVSGQYGNLSPEEQAQALDFGKTAMKKEILGTEMAAEKIQPLPTARPSPKPVVQPMAAPEWSQRSAMGDETAQAAARVREQINADQEYKGIVQGALQELRGEQEERLQGIKNDAEWERTIQQGKDRIRASAAAGTGRQKMEQDFMMQLGKEYRTQHPEYKTDAEAVSHLEQLKKLPAGGGSPIQRMDEIDRIELQNIDKELAKNSEFPDLADKGAVAILQDRKTAILNKYADGAKPTAAGGPIMLPGLGD